MEVMRWYPPDAMQNWMKDKERIGSHARIIRINKTTPRKAEKMIGS